MTALPPYWEDAATRRRLVVLKPLDVRHCNLLSKIMEIDALNGAALALTA